MKKLNQTDLLNEAITALAFKQKEDYENLKLQFKLTYDSLKPVNIVKNALLDMTSVPDLKNNIVSNVIGLTTGYLSKKVVLGGSHNPIKRILGNLLQFVVTNVIAKQSNPSHPKEIEEQID
jgi:hypothetical protein